MLTDIPAWQYLVVITDLIIVAMSKEPIIRYAVSLIAIIILTFYK